MKRILLLCSMLAIALITTETFAQDRIVTGRVTGSDDGLPLPQVTVLLKGTTQGTPTDADGNYRLSIPTDGGILVFRYLGYVTQEIAVGNQSILNIQLVPDATSLGEVVVTGYGGKTRDELASAVSVVNLTEIEAFNPTLSIDNLLQGKAAGVSVVGGNGRPGQTAIVNIRGITSINAGTNPLYIVDGVPVDPSNINNIAPQDIESLSVLKDAATAALYGSRAGNGVIVITTKKGKEGQAAKINFRASYGRGELLKDPFQLMDAQQALTYESELAALGVSAAQSLPGGRLQPSEWGPFLNRNTDWTEELFQSSVIENYSLSASGGNEAATYFFSVSQDKNSGLLHNLDGFERISGRLNTTFKASDRVTLGINFNVSQQENDLPRDRNNVQNQNRARFDYKPYATVFVTDDNGDLVLDENGEPSYNFGEGIGLGFNVAEATVNNLESVKNLVTVASTYADIKISDAFNFRTTIGISNDRFSRESFLKPGSRLDQFVGDANNPGSKTDNGSNDFRFVWTNVLSYNTTIKGKHNISARALYEYNRRRFSRFSLTSEGFVTDRLSVQDIASIPTGAGSFATENILASYGLFADYTFDNKYVFNVSVRRDGSSRFGADNRWGTFGAVSAAWNIHNEEFFDVSAISNLKLRASYGISGNQQIGDFSSLSTVQFGSRNGRSTVIPTGEADPALQWESQEILDIGLEAGLFDNKVRLVLDYFQRTSSDLLGQRPLSQTVGDENNVIQTNIGEIQTNGLEIEASTTVLSNKDWVISVGGNVTFLDTKVNSLSDGVDIFRRFTLLREGEEINTYFLNRYAGVNPANGEPLWLDADGNVTNVFDGADAVALEGKTPVPEFEGGFFISATWKGFDLRADAVFRGGHYIYNAQKAAGVTDGNGVNRNQWVESFNYWKNPGDVNVLPNPIFNNISSNGSDRFLQKGDYMRLRNLTLGYTLPVSLLDKIFLQNARIFVQGQNLLTWTLEYDGDPEIGIGSGETVSPGGNGFVAGEFSLFSYPQSRIFTVGLDITF